ncbi:hypothetical protein BHE74_00009444 [Ensete ventricosum]|nr:hypothetical protein BHE74_00009444 [Ensete ventricosum]
MRAGSRGGGGLRGEDGEGQRRSVGGGCERVDVWGNCCGKGDGDMVASGSSREERNRGGQRRKRRPREQAAAICGCCGRRGGEEMVVGDSSRGGRRGKRSIMWIPLERKMLGFLHPLHSNLEYRDIRSP